jgi:hypothetical protein
VTLAISLQLVLATHVYWFPRAAAAVIVATVLLFPATRRWKEPLVALLPSLALGGAAFLARDGALAVSGSLLQRADWTRLSAPLLDKIAFLGFTIPEEGRDAHILYSVILAVLAVCVIGWFAERRWRTWSIRDRRFHAGAVAVVAAGVAVSFCLFLVLPRSHGVWFWIYPREILGGALPALALIPDLPRPRLLRVTALLALALAAANMSGLVAREYAAFEARTDDFRRITERIPPAPRLAYLVFDLAGTDFFHTPYVHLPAWVQAEKGGSLSFHFASFNATPIRYRQGSDAVPPPTPDRFEWKPDLFDVATRGRFFDWFLVRSADDPAPKLAADPALRPVDHAGEWWLYRRATVQ